MSEKKKEIIFVYNADSGFVSAVKDTFHKAFRKSTYQCNLCAVTFGTFGMKKDWKNFVQDIDKPEDSQEDKFDITFIHKDEFYERFDFKDAKFPSAYLKSDESLELFITQEEMDDVKELDELKSIVNDKIKSFGL